MDHILNVFISELIKIRFVMLIYPINPYRICYLARRLILD